MPTGIYFSAYWFACQNGGLKESFTQTPEAVHFTLLWRISQHGPWQHLQQVERPRLKTARLLAYGDALTQHAPPTP